MNRHPLKRAGAALACSCLLWGGSVLRAATVASAPAGMPAIAPVVLDSSRGAGSDAVDATASATPGEGIAAIPLPPSAYPGMVGLATAALSVWRYRRRRR